MRDTYLKLKNDPNSVSIAELSFLVSQIYQNPRLAEVICEFIRDNWINYNGQELNKMIANLQNSNRLYTILEQISQLTHSDKTTLHLFNNWVKEVLKDISVPKEKEMFFDDSTFSGLSKDSISFLKEDIKENSLESFTKYNFYGKDIFFNKQIFGNLKNPQN